MTRDVKKGDSKGNFVGQFHPIIDIVMFEMFETYLKETYHTLSNMQALYKKKPMCLIPNRHMKII